MRADIRVDEIEREFARADEDDDGQISLAEFRGLMLDLDWHMKDGAVGTTFLAIDADHNGRIGCAEFRA
jgi:Ca2+-binding EF-hand superfamily protein